LNNTALIFFDTEFTELGVDPRLISIGFVSEDGKHSFYAELIDTYNKADCSDFTEEFVLPLLQGGEALLSMKDLGERLANWLESFARPVQLVTDSLAWDWPWIIEILDGINHWPSNLDRTPFILQPSLELNNAIKLAASRGLRKHHALDDAKANRLGYLAYQE
jgi:hypothetical protein